MTKYLLTLVTVAAILFLPSGVKGQVQPIPVIQSKGSMINLGTGIVVLTDYGPYDFTGYTAATIVVTHAGGCTALTSVTTLGADTAGGTYRNVRGINGTRSVNLTSPDAFVVGTPLPYIKFRVSPQGAGCTISAWMTPIPFTSSTDVSGSLPAGVPVSVPYPVLVGGVYAGASGDESASIRVDNNGRVYVVGGGSGTGLSDVAQYGATYSFQVPTTCALAASTSCPVALVASACYQVTCTVDAFVRTGAGVPVAVTTDTPLYAKVIMKPVCLTAAENAMAFISASAGTCYASRMNLVP